MLFEQYRIRVYCILLNNNGLKKNYLLMSMNLETIASLVKVLGMLIVVGSSGKVKFTVFKFHLSPIVVVQKIFVESV